MATPCPGVNFSRSSLVIITIYSVRLLHAPECRRKLFTKYIIYFTLFTPKLPPFESWVKKFTISCLLPLPMLHTKFGKDWEEAVNPRSTTNDARRRTPTHSYRSSESLKWLKNTSYFLKWFKFECNTSFDWLKTFRLFCIIYVFYVIIRLTLKTYQSARRYI